MATDTRWFEGWEKRPYQNMGKVARCNRFPQLKAKGLYHGMEGVFHQIETLYRFATIETKLPVHLWFADEDTTSWQYEKYKGSYRRVFDDSGKPVRARKGYSAMIQTLPADLIAWSAKSCRQAVNYGGEVVIAIEDMMWAGDAGLFTEDELYRRGLMVASASRGIMRFTDKDFVPRAFRDQGAPWPKSRGRFNGQRMKRAQYLDDVFLAGRNIIAHADLPRPNSHGDVADMMLGKVCEIARHELDQRDAGATKGTVSPPKPEAAEGVAKAAAAPAAAPSVRVQQIGQARQILERVLKRKDANEKDLEATIKLLTPKEKK